MAYDGSLRFDSKIDTTGFAKGTNTINSQAKGLTSTFKKLGVVIGAVFISKKIFDISKQAVYLASNLNEVQNVVDTAFGSMSYKMEEFAKTSIKTFGMSQLSAKQTGSQYMAMAVGMGIAQDKASDMAIALTGLSGDMSSFYNVSQDEAKTALASVFTGETETLKRYGVVMTQTNLQEFARTKGITKSISAMTQQEQTMLRAQFVTKQLSLAQGDFAKTSGSWANQTRILSEQWKQFLTILGSGLIKILAPVVRGINAVMSQLISFATTASSVMSSLFGDDNAKSQNKTTAAIQASVSATDDLATAQDNLQKSVDGRLASFDQLEVLSQPDTTSTTDTGIGGISAGTVTVPPVDTTELSTFSAKVATLLEPAKQAFINFGEAVKPFADNIGAGLKWFYDNVLVPLASWTANDLLPAFLGLLSGAFDVLNAVIEALKPLAKWLWDAFLQPIAIWSGGVIIDALNGLAVALGNISDWIKNNQVAFTVITGIVGLFFAAWEIATLGEFIINAGGVVGMFTELTQAIWLATGAKIADKAETLAIVALYVEDFAVAIASSIAGFAEQTASIIASTAAKIATTVAQTAMTVATTAWNVICVIAAAVTWAFGAAMAFLTSPIFLIVLAIVALIAIVVLLIRHWDDVKAVASAVWDAIVYAVKVSVGAIGNFFVGLWEGIKSILSAIGNFFKEVFNGIVNIAKVPLNFILGFINKMIDGINTLISGINKVKIDVPDWVPLIGGESFGFNIPKVPNIPQLATGAVIPPNSEFLAMLGDQKKGVNIETPLATMVEAFETANAKKGGNGQPLTIVLKMGAKEFTRVIIDNINDLTRSSGELAIDLI